MDQKSVKIMVMLMLFLLENEMTTAQFFESVSFQQRVNSESGEQVLDLLKADDFFRLLAQRGIRKKANDHANLR
jgi:hypothetical protein